MAEQSFDDWIQPHRGLLSLKCSLGQHKCHQLLDIFIRYPRRVRGHGDSASYIRPIALAARLYLCNQTRLGVRIALVAFAYVAPCGAN